MIALRKTCLLTAMAVLVMTLFTGCDDDEVISEGMMTFRFEHKIGNLPIEFDQMKYENTAGNTYEVSEIQWFISDLTLNRSDGLSFTPGQDSAFAHYVDTDLTDTREWQLTGIPAGEYHSITATFGLKGEKNTPGRFPNAPERDMIWPYPMGGDQGGYHYMKLNGFWIDPEGKRQPFNFHLGVGQDKDQNEHPIFVQNWFEFELENSSFTLVGGEALEVTMTMNVENWFKDPHIYDHNQYGGKIMRNQEAMAKGCENGKHGVFTISSIQRPSPLSP